MRPGQVKDGLGMQGGMEDAVNQLEDGSALTAAFSFRPAGQVLCSGNHNPENVFLGSCLRVFPLFSCSLQK